MLSLNLLNYRDFRGSSGADDSDVNSGITARYQRTEQRNNSGYRRRSPLPERYADNIDAILSG
jgi:hypothetical protein